MRIDSCGFAFWLKRGEWRKVLWVMVRWYRVESEQCRWDSCANAVSDAKFAQMRKHGPGQCGGRGDGEQLPKGAGETESRPSHHRGAGETILLNHPRARRAEEERIGEQRRNAEARKNATTSATRRAETSKHAHGGAGEKAEGTSPYRTRRARKGAQKPARPPKRAANAPEPEGDKRSHGARLRCEEQSRESPLRDDG